MEDVFYIYYFQQSLSSLQLYKIIRNVSKLLPMDVINIILFLKYAILFMLETNKFCQLIKHTLNVAVSPPPRIS